ncbi:FadL protein [Porphyromonas pogonae]|uniref:OmpP1/FadL family transporter n=1 Tax=Porphyromonas pogonae TaxID=867595 RepID=UPI002E785EAD|nr:FadL protein [Porphyromonas pogonae]
MRKLFTAAIMALGLGFTSAHAGGLLTNTSLHILYLRSVARNASTKIDAVYYNPAGLAFTKEGFQLSVNSQSAFQKRIINTTFAPFAYNGGSPTKEFVGTASAPVIPSVMAVYKKGDWAFSAMFGLTGGGGKASFSGGLGSYESIVSLIPAFTSKLAPQLGIKRYDLSSELQGHQYVFGTQLGAAYKINKYLSAAAGIRINYVNDRYSGFVSSIKVNDPQGAMVPATAYFMTLANNLASTNPAAATQMKLLAGATGDKKLEVSQRGWGITPIIGLNFNYEKFNFGLKYEFNTHLNVENKTKENTTGDEKFKNGIDTPHDIPAMLALGASYHILPSVTASLGYNYFFEKQTKMQGDKQKFLKHGTAEYLAGVEWSVNRWLDLSAGLQLTRNGATDRFMEDMSFNLNSNSVGFGAGFNLTDKMTINVAYFVSKYKKFTKESEIYNNLPTRLEGLGLPQNLAAFASIPGKEVFSRTSKVFGIGIDYRF